MIWDGHDGSRTLSVDEIHESAKLLQGRPTPANYYLSERLYDGVMFVGQHAMAGAKNAVLAHSQSFSVKRIAINGREVGEVGQIAAIAGYFGIPVIMLAGDEAACAELTALQPKAVTVAVKRLAGKASSFEPVARRSEAPDRGGGSQGCGARGGVRGLEDRWAGGDDDRISGAASGATGAADADVSRPKCAGGVRGVAR